MTDLAMTVIDSHTGGEPTRLVLSGGPPLGGGSLVERRARFAAEFDQWRSFAVNEPRGTDALVGALLCEPLDPACAAGLIFFNNVGYLGMCGHGTIGAAVTLMHMGRIGLGRHRFETPVGVVTVTLTDRHRATIENCPSYRHLEGIAVDVPGHGIVTGDVAWGGNWFFLTHDTPVALTPGNIPDLTRHATAIRAALVAAGHRGADGGEIDHVELFGPAGDGADSRNFVLCPGGAYDRSPCGTGTSAKVACLAAAGVLAPGVDWVQESIVGSRFTVRYRRDAAGAVVPSITGEAYVVAETTLRGDPADPFRRGMRG